MILTNLKIAKVLKIARRVTERSEGYEREGARDDAPTKFCGAQGGAKHRLSEADMGPGIGSVRSRSGEGIKRVGWQCVSFLIFFICPGKYIVLKIA
jgi:hypothetical protein